MPHRLTTNYKMKRPLAAIVVVVVTAREEAAKIEGVKENEEKVKIEEKK